ncbi:MAG: hypothetical protein EOM83_10470 [Clostridia bacterium]|nr:hypothetical protein [Clostridia bacterium]
MKRLIYGLFIATILTACSSSDFERVGYFKSPAKFRVFTVNTSETAEVAMNDFAASLPNTPGCPTVVYFYPGNAIDPSAMSTFERVIEVCDASDYSYRWWKNPNGEVVAEWR